MIATVLLLFIKLRHIEQLPNQQLVCGSSSFRCKSGQCIPFDLQCDGRKDCLDGSDETIICKDNLCMGDFFTCAYGACVNGDAECDGKQDCDDNSDELTHKCRNITIIQGCGIGKFACTSGTCINDFLLCDGPEDCNDGSDETILQCGQTTCPDLSFRCLYGACIDGDKRCNDKIDCADSSDESFETCGRDLSPSTPITRLMNDSNISRGTKKLKNGCMLPKNISHGYYTSSIQSMTQKPGEVVADFTVLTFLCEDGYQLYPNRKYLVCENGKWSYEVPKCKKICGAITSSTVDIKCTLNEVEQSCLEPLLDGTIATMSCKQWYESLQPLTYNTAMCKNGSWTSAIPNCLPVCGQRIAKGTPLIVNGRSADKGEYPWQISVYEVEGTETLHVCGGSMISPKVVISAAHCFTDFNGNHNSRDKYILAAGNYYRQLNERRDFGVQKAGVDQIFIPDAYKGINRNFAEDIAVVVLNITLKLTPFIQPVCVDWTNTYEDRQFIPGELGEVSGWGYVQEGSPDAAETLRSLSVPFVDFNECYDHVPEDFRPFLTTDKFCAGYKNGSSVCQGDSGGGLVFKYEKRYYLRGIVSVGPQLEDSCNSFEYGAYTKVSKFLDYISKIEVLFRP